MNEMLIGQIVTKLATMDGKYWPPLRQGERMDADRASYAEVLVGLPDAAGEVILGAVLTSFMARPSHKALRDWAAAHTPQAQYRLPWLEAPPSGDRPRLTGPVPSGVGEILRGAPPPAVKELFARMRTESPPPESAAEYGLQFRDRATGRTSWTHASYRLARAEAVAAERNAKWPHVETTVYHRDDPLPDGLADASGPEVAEGREAVLA